MGRLESSFAFWAVWHDGLLERDLDLDFVPSFLLGIKLEALE